MRSDIHLALIATSLLLVAGLTGVVATAQVVDPQQPQANVQGGGSGAGGGNGGRRGGGAGGGGGGRGGAPVTLDPAQISYLKTLYAPPPNQPFPASNPATPEKLELGKQLFFETGLSGNNQIACATCHDARHGFADPLALSIGVKGAPLARRTQPVVNLAWQTRFFWDGRADTAEAQAVMPIENEDEMGMPHALMTERLNADLAYRRMFAKAFPGEAIGPDTVGKALAVFERSLVTADTAFDRWVAGDEDAISDQAKRGFVEFNTRAGCAQCHAGWNFSDGSFNNIGIADKDLGRSLIAPGEEEHGFKTPSLRNVANRAPYMHNGGLATLQQVLRHYRRPAADRATLSSRMANVRTGRGGDIVAFLQTLSATADPELVGMQEALEQRTRGRSATATLVADR